MIKPGIHKYDWEVELSDAKSKRRYGLKIAPGSLQIGTISGDDTVYVRNVGKRVGDFDEQRSWKGGRGIENLSDNAEGFYDSLNAWTLSPEHLHQTLQWYPARGLKAEDIYMPTRDSGDVQFQPLLGSTLYIGNSFSASSSYSADKAYLWIRRKGSPGTLTFKLAANNAGDPGTVSQTVTKTVSDIDDYVSVYELFDWTGTESLTSSTTYWVYVYGASTDNRDNHWEVGVNPDATSGKVSSDGSTWAAASFAMYYHVTSADTARRWYRFYVSGAMYLIDSKDDGSTASVIYINGDRGKATAATSTTISDSGKSWTTNRWANAWVKIWNGTGKGNAPKKIASNTSTQLTIDGTWETTPSTDSEYVIYATEWFTQVSPTGDSLSACSGEPAVVNNIAYIPQGTGKINHFRWNAATPAHNLDVEATNVANKLIASNDPADGPIIWRINNVGGTGSGGEATVSRANLLSSGSFIAWDTALTFATAIFTGPVAFSVTNIAKKDQTTYVWREDGLGGISANQMNTIETGIEKTPDPANGAFVISHGQFLYYSWLHSLVRVYGSTHDDIGDDFRSVGLPDGREGVFTDGDTYIKWLFTGVDAGTSGWSSVLIWDGLGWHEMVRAPRAGMRVRMVKVQTCPGTRNRLWTQCGDMVIFQELPFKKAAPRLDSGARYQHEAVLVSSVIDMGTASAMPKLIKNITATVKNLNTRGKEVYLDIQTDDDCFTDNWTPYGVMSESPESTLFLGLNCNRFAYRLRICTNDNTIPVDIEGVVPNGYARTPYRLVFSMQIQAGGIYTRRGKSANAGELTRWLLDQARTAGYVNMTSVFEMAHGWKVIIHPPRTFPISPKKGNSPEAANMTLTLTEV
jgi:hypothetical protein